MQLDELRAELLKARKAGNTVAKAVLQSLIADFDKMARTGKEVDGVALARKYAENASNNCDLELQRGNQEAAEKYLAEKVFIEINLLPKQLTEAELREIIEGGCFNNIGQVMKYLKGDYAGQYDPKAASIIAKEIL